MHIIELKIHKFLKEVQQGKYKIPEHLLTKFEDETKTILKKYFEHTDDRPFHLTMGNVGRPSCQLKFEYSGVKGEDTDNIIRNLYGDIAEDLLMFLLHASGIKVISEQERVSITIADTTINGILDIVLDLGDGPSVWDIKSTSSWAFKNKFNDFNSIVKDDPFGYISQLFLYAHAKNIKAGGWIAFDKSSGEIKVIPISNEQQKSTMRNVLLSTNSKIIDYNNYTKDISIKKEFTPITEVFRKVPTGNTYLDTTCSFCKFKWQCWDNLKLLPQAKSIANNPQMRYYVEYKE